MLRLRPISDIKAVLAYHSKSDGGYLLGGDDLGMRWLGDGAERLSLKDKPTYEQFERLLRGLDPHSGDQLTAKLIEGRLAGWEATISIPKGPTIAMLRGDTRVKGAVWDSVQEAIADLQAHIVTRVRKGQEQDDRLTGNLVALAIPHPETRPTKDDGMPDPDWHYHVIIFNLTEDPVEQEWKAIKFRPIMDLRKWFDRRFDMRLASKLADLGYGIETKYKAGRYHTWDIKGLDALAKKFSRRTGEVEKLAAELKVESAVGKDKLGATSRLHKRDDMTLEDYRRYWDARVTPEEARQAAEVIKAAILGRNPRQENTADRGAEYAIGHEFYTRSVVPLKQLEVTAMEQCMGGGRPEEIEPELRREGVLIKNGEATTREVLAEEGRIIDFARDGRGTMRPLHEVGTAMPEKSDTLSRDQQAAIRHVWNSSDRVILIRGGAGTGKTTMMKTAIAGIDKPVAVLAPTSTASRGVLRDDGFKDANTVASFLQDKAWQAKIDGGVIWVDEASLLPIDDLERLCRVAEERHARLVLQGDPKQHKSVARNGNMFTVLREFAGLPMADLKDVQRQKGEYRDATMAIQEGDILKGHAILGKLGWVNQVEDLEKAIADECWDYVKRKESFIVVGITHDQNDAITEELRKRLRAEGKIDAAEVPVETLRPLHWSPPQRADLARYDGTEVIQFTENTGPFRKGQRVNVDALRACGRTIDAEYYAVYAPRRIGLSKGDVVVTTAGQRPKDGRRIDNGSRYTFLGLTKKGDLTLKSGNSKFVLPKEFKHLAHGLVDTSMKAQGQTKIRAIGALTEKNFPGINAAQYYVTVSRAKKSGKLFTTLDPETVREAIQRQDKNKSATELMGRPKPKPRYNARAFVKRVQLAYKRLREQVVDATRPRGYDHAREAYAR